MLPQGAVDTSQLQHLMALKKASEGGDAGPKPVARNPVVTSKPVMSGNTAPRTQLPAKQPVTNVTQNPKEMQVGNASKPIGPRMSARALMKMYGDTNAKV